MTFPDEINIQDYSEFRTYLQQLLVERCRLNPAYSLRAFAKSLGIDSSSLSKILGGKRAITPSMFLKLAQSMGFGPKEYQHFNDQVLNLDNETKKDQYRQLSVETFELISQWYHYAILELTHLKFFKADLKWIARTLGITYLETKMACDRLVKLGFLEIKPNGQWKDISEGVTTINNPFTHCAFRKLQKGILKQASSVMETVPFELRDQSSMTMAIDREKIPEAKEIIKKFRRELCDLLKSTKDFDDVYQLSISLFPATQKNLGVTHDQ